ncbi:MULTISPECIES: chlorinating enzyme [Micromonospora]|uniref:Chlorinating enzyme n=1 Tax=Micromonospora profundi TaxID=1420889 RepID=A0AAJ6L4T5_9ACTN|nr:MULTISPECIES: chlorinating enzyme [Micromonospora]NJC10954.1 non-heme Fe2+,alpha-ketoglutarate-dependent halogenase [Micromonospora profundi]WLS48465.1 chlorinating enzyme [Micromonospora profundi]
MTNTLERNFTPSPEEVAQFHQRGYLGPFKVYEEDEMQRLWKRERLRLMDRSQAVYDEGDAQAGNTNIANYDRHLDSTFLADHICRPEIVDRVTAVLGPNVLCWRSEFFPKYPGDEGTDWHQADTFAFASGKPQIVWPEAEREYGGTLTVWTAFTEATEETACLQFIPGTQRTMYYDETKGMHYQPDKINAQRKEDGVTRGFYGYDYRELQKDPDWKPPVDQAVSMIMRPGEAVMFWSTMMHASKPHSAPDKGMRLGFAGRYVPTCVEVYPDTDDVDEYGGRVSLQEYGTVLVAGVDTYTHNRKVTTTTRGHKFPVR